MNLSDGYRPLAGALYAAAKGLVFRMASESGAILWTCKIKGLAYSKSYGHTTLALSGSGHELFYGLHGRIGGVNCSSCCVCVLIDGGQRSMPEQARSSG